MVYHWEKYKDTLHSLYVHEAKPVDYIIEYMRLHHGFSPSKRAFAAQFRRWNFPSRQQPALKNRALVCRVRELWERNCSQNDMLRTLTDEGFYITLRELSRVRRHHRLLLRTPKSEVDRAASGDDVEAAAVGHLHDLDSDDGFLSCGHFVSQDQDTGNSVFSVAIDPQLELDASSELPWGVKKRRRRTRQYGGLPADPPGPPRFPSETTLAESTKLLALDKPTYMTVRAKFQAICEAAGINRKSTAGGEAWERAKAELVTELPVLNCDLWTETEPGRLEQRKLALDIICTDVTKRMRAGASDKVMVLADAKNILELNPSDTREVRAAFHRMLKDEGLASKSAMGAERWKALKQKWIDENEQLSRTLSKRDKADDYEMKSKAVEVIANDVMKRMRNGISKK
ncbi:Clr5 domain-domain-containing protein, partial [Coniella lustricola]